MKNFKEFLSVKEDPSQEVQHLSQDIQRRIDQLFQVLSRHQLNKQQYKSILINMITNLADTGNLSNANIRQATNNAIRTNNEPITIPMQPQVD